MMMARRLRREEEEKETGIRGSDEARKMIHHPLAPARGRCGIIIPQRAASRGRGKVWWNGRADYAIAREDGRKRPWSRPPRGREQGRKTTCSCVYARASSRSC